MTSHRIAVVLGAVGLCAAAARAEILWTTQMQFRNRVGVVDSAPLAGNLFTVTATGTYTFSVQVGMFSVTGLGPLEANYGVNNWTANVSATGLLAGETLGLTVTNARVTPFNFGPATSFAGHLVSPSRIEDVDAARDVSGGAYAPWGWDSNIGDIGPMPTLPTNPSVGAESYATVWRFRVTVTELSGSDIAVTFTGQAGPVVRWVEFMVYPPSKETSYVTFLGLTPFPVLRDYAPTTLTLRRVPTPGAVAVLGAGAFCVARRRRSGRG